MKTEESKQKVRIEICMGSSCFSRGNRKNLEVIQNYLQTYGLENRVDLRGRLCAGNCRKGPNIEINGQVYSEVNPSALNEILSSAFSRNLQDKAEKT
ncbi:MAG: (2Fe-2S) ferredoxin domain-containing protein [Spirochaetales bacterium]